jgi:transposase-like protein
VHFVRNLLAHIPKADKAQVAATVRTMFTQPDRHTASQRLTAVTQELQKNGRKLRFSCKMRKPMSWPLWTFRQPIGVVWLPITCWNASIVRFDAVPMWFRFFLIRGP